MDDLSNAELFIVIRRSRMDASRAYPVARMPNGKTITLTWESFYQARLKAKELSQAA